MRILFVAISAVILFFPAFWLFSAAAGNDWGAGIAAVFMYVWYPFMAMKFLGRNDVKISEHDMNSALEKGMLGVSEYEVLSYIEIEEFEDEGLFFLLGIEPHKTLCLRGQYLYDAEDNKNFPSSRVRVFRNKEMNFIYGVEAIGTSRLFPLRKIPPLTEAQLSAKELPGDGEIIESDIESVAKEIDRLS